MTQVFKDDKVVPVTIVEVPKNVVCSVIPAEGVTSLTGVELGLGSRKNSNKSEKGKYSDIKKVPSSVWTVWTEEQDITSGAEFGPEIAQGHTKAKVSGITKGKGFTGVVKRWGFHGGPKTHGQSDRHRAPGSIGAGTDPGRIWKGTKMAGKSGAIRNTMYNREIVEVGDDYLLIKGTLPGNEGGVLRITLEN